MSDVSNLIRIWARFSSKPNEPFYNYLKSLGYTKPNLPNQAQGIRLAHPFLPKFQFGKNHVDSRPLIIKSLHKIAASTSPFEQKFYKPYVPRSSSNVLMSSMNTKIDPTTGDGMNVLKLSNRVQKYLQHVPAVSSFEKWTTRQKRLTFQVGGFGDEEEAARKVEEAVAQGEVPAVEIDGFLVGQIDGEGTENIEFVPFPGKEEALENRRLMRERAKEREEASE